MRKYIEAILERRKGLKLSEVFHFEEMRWLPVVFPFLSLEKKIKRKIKALYFSHSNLTQKTFSNKSLVQLSGMTQCQMLSF